MKYDSKHLPVVLAVVLILFSAVKAEAVQEKDVGLYFPLERDFPQSRPYCFVSPFTVRHTILSEDGREAYSGDCAPKLIRLAGEEEQAIAAYCTDAVTSLQPGAVYRRTNLEDSLLFDDATAGKIRSILQNAYPQLAVQEIQEKANIWLKQRELPLIRQLQSGEAVLAAQIAVWKLAGDSRYTVHSLFSGTIDISAYSGLVSASEELSQHPTGYTAENVESLYTFYCNMGETPQHSRLISDASIVRTRFSHTKHQEGGYNTEISITVEASVGEQDKLTLLACCGEQVQELDLLEAGTFTFLFERVPKGSAVTLQIEGEQYGADVFLFDPAGESGPSQTLLGYHEGILPVFCSRTILPLYPD